MVQHQFPKYFCARSLNPQKSPLADRNLRLAADLEVNVVVKAEFAFGRSSRYIFG